MLYRIFFSGGDFPTTWDEFRHFGPLSSRFDHQLPNAMGEPEMQDRGILYGSVGGEAIPTCLAEVFQNSKVIDRFSRAPVLCAFTLATSLTLLDLTGPFATRMGASMAINSGPRPRARRWARVLYEAYPEIDGILYSSSMYGNRPALALFERAQPAVPTFADFHRSLADPALAFIIEKTGDHIGYSVI